MAAQTFYVHLDLNKNEIQNAVIQNLASAPGSPVEGQIYYDNSGGDKKPYFYDGTSWVAMASVGTSDHGGLSGLEDDDHSQYLLLAPGSSTRNVLESSGAFIPLTIKASATQGSNALLEFDDNSDNNLSGVYADGKFYVPAGDASAPGLTFTGDATTGIYSAASDTVSISTDGTNRITIGNSSIDVNDLPITGLADPTDPQDAATKAYVDGLASGVDWKGSVRVATTEDITIASDLNDGDEIDGVTLADGDRVLVKNQSSPEENGIYVVDDSPFRAADADSDTEVTGGMAVWVNEGDVNGDTGWILITDDDITLDTTELTFTQFTGLGQVTAGDGLTKTGNTLDVVGTTDRITVNADSIDIAATYTGQSSITTLGTITSGVWNGTDIAVADGGTGRGTATAYMPIVGGTTSTGAHQSVSAGSTTGQALTYQGASAVPTFAAINLAGGTNIVTGTLPAANGGTGQSSYTVGDLLYASGSTALSKLAGVATGNVLISGGVSTAPSWGKVGLATHVSGTLPVANGGTGIASYTTGYYIHATGATTLAEIAPGDVLTDIGAAADDHTHDDTYVKMITDTIGDNSNTSFVIEHNLNTRAVGVEVFRTASPYDTINVSVERNDPDEITITTNNAPTTDEYTVVIWGIDNSA